MQIETLTAGQSPEAVRHHTALIKRYFGVQETHDIDTWAEMWTEDAVFRAPYGPSSFPDKFEGRDVFVPMFRELFEGYGTVKIGGIDVYAAPDPGVFAAVWDVSIEIKATGLRYESRNFGIFRFRGDQIEDFVEYFNPLKFAKAAGLDLTADL
ncbi:nuclear transport factor 2 family protein [Actibacterium sp. 188UL27-1]|uniref:nuclear transport factor 2 family protein n=1 Tax=Actibacterium sp. 188UL27-1 TaxID=2786961 RepID=UPI00195A927E|nr:nuclear transport factor 2 family protein [Actibacterium sp. 188UL27-1]MBM7067551.1 nuclear transport factor 2 family protein [Actibacterium sp. 188UL27-1]